MLALPGAFASQSVISLFTQQTCTDHPQLRLPEHLLSVQLRVLGFHMFLIHGCFSINNQGSVSRLQMGNRSLDNRFIQYCLLALYCVPGIMPQGLGTKGERKQMWLLLLCPDLLTGSFWGSQESTSGPLVFSGVQSQYVGLCVSLCGGLSTSLPPCTVLVPSSRQGRGGRGLGRGPHLSRGGSRRCPG